MVRVGARFSQVTSPISLQFANKETVNDLRMYSEESMRSN
jgi:hypothetical protein